MCEADFSFSLPTPGAGAIIRLRNTVLWHYTRLALHAAPLVTAPQNLQALLELRNVALHRGGGHCLFRLKRILRNVVELRERAERLRAVEVGIPTVLIWIKFTTTKYLALLVPND